MVLLLLYCRAVDIPMTHGPFTGQLNGSVTTYASFLTLSLALSGLIVKLHNGESLCSCYYVMILCYLAKQISPAEGEGQCPSNPRKTSPAGSSNLSFHSFWLIAHPIAPGTSRESKRPWTRQAEGRTSKQGDVRCLYYLCWMKPVDYR